MFSLPQLNRFRPQRQKRVSHQQSTGRKEGYSMKGLAYQDAAFSASSMLNS